MYKTYYGRPTNVEEWLNEQVAEGYWLHSMAAGDHKMYVVVFKDVPRYQTK